MQGFRRITLTHFHIEVLNAVAFSDCPSLAVGVDFSATVYFKNGNSKGEQSIKAETFEGLVAKVNAFIAGLP